MKRVAADGELTASNVVELSKSSMCFIWSLCCHPKTDLLDGELQDFDEAVRSVQESFIIHTWFGYLIVSEKICYLVERCTQI